jgi:hypothetical protein
LIERTGQSLALARIGPATATMPAVNVRRVSFIHPSEREIVAGLAFHDL